MEGGGKEEGGEGLSAIFDEARVQTDRNPILVTGGSPRVKCKRGQRLQNMRKMIEFPVKLHVTRHHKNHYYHC